MAPKRKGVRNVGRTCALEVIQGPLSGSVITKKGKIFRIGRTKASKLQIKEDTVSEKHGELVWKDSCWKIRDLGSSNGTAVNDVELEDEYVILKDGDRIRIGEVTVVVFRDVSEEEGGAVGNPEQPDVEKRAKIEDEAVKITDEPPAEEIVEEPPKADGTKEDDLTVLEYLEKECSSLQEEIMNKGMSVAEQLRQRWNLEKEKLLQLL